jgi:hypothetical protein
MIGLYLANEFLDLFENTRVNFRRNNDIYTSGDPTISLGSYSFPFDLPLTAKNRRMLRFPDRIDNFYTLLSDAPVWFYAGEGSSMGLPLFEGKLYIKSATRDTVTAFMIVDGFSALRDTKFEDIDLGSVAYSHPQDIIDVANDTLHNPLDYPFVFSPVFNPRFIDEGNNGAIPEDTLVFPPVAFTNIYLPDLQSLIPITWDLPAVVTPFLRINWILEQIVASWGYTIDNQLQIDDEFRLLYIFNNFSIYGDAIGEDTTLTYTSDWRTRIDFNNHVPPRVALVDFLKIIARNFFCGFFIDTTSKLITLVPLRDLLDAPHASDWTSKTFNDYAVENDTHIPRFVGYAADPDDQLFATGAWRDRDTFPTIIDHDGFNNPASDGFYYFLASDEYRQISSENQVERIQFFERIQLPSGLGEPFESRAIPLFMFSSVPQVLMRGTGAFFKPTEENPFGAVRQENELRSIRLFLYRGIIEIDDFPTPFPYSNNSAWNPDTKDYDYNHSLLWQGPNGIYEKYAKEWIYFMENKKIVKRLIKLSLADILNFRDTDKIHIDGQYFFVKSMSISFTHAGMDPVECELVSIPSS